MLRFSGLNVRVVGGVDREGGGTGPLVVLLHGYGAPGDDLVSLPRVLDVPREVRFAFPEAPLSPPELAMYGGRAWWQIDVMALQQAAAAGRARERMRETPVGLVEARQSVGAMLDELARELAVPADQLVLGGFSQGAMLALDLALHSNRQLAGLILLSATFLNRDVWQPLMAARMTVPVLQTHGTQDPLLGFDIAVELRDALRAAGSNVEWVEFRGGHELPHSALEAVGRFIRAAV
jgi:phospholipase/carboxylesterase